MQRETVETLTIRRLTADSPLFVEAVGRATDMWRVGQVNEGLGMLIQDSQRRGLTIDPVLGVFDGERLRFACLAIESPGHAALVFGPWSQLAGSSEAQAVNAALEMLMASLSKRGVQLVEVLLPADEAVKTVHLTSCGFRHLTQLIYLRRRIGPSEPNHVPSVTPGLAWFDFAPQREGLFIRALELSYQQSLDCPELTALRSTPDVLAGHRSVGAFDPSLWLVACDGTEPVGVLLMSRIARQAGMEIVYMGVAAAARGRGVGDALLARAMEEAGRCGANHLALAVDKRNGPARRLYARWGFVELVRRDAWIATPVAATG